MSGDAPRSAMTDGLVLGREAEGGTVRLSSTVLAGHGLICGVTGSGKTNTAKVMAEGLSALGVPVFAVDAKGDFAGISQAGRDGTGPAQGRQPPPMIPWDVEGRRGHRLAFRTTAAGGLRARQLSQVHDGGAGYVGVLEAADLIEVAPAYAGTVCELITHLAAGLPSQPVPVGHLQMAVVVEEAHLVFRHTRPQRHRALARALLRLTAHRVAVMFVTPDPAETPRAIDEVLGFRIQHSLWQAPEASLARLRDWFASAPRPADGDIVETVRSLAIGEALVALARGAPAARVRIARSATRDGPISEGERRRLIALSSADASIQAPGISRVAEVRRARAGLRSHGRRPLSDRAAP